MPFGPNRLYHDNGTPLSDEEQNKFIGKFENIPPILLLVGMAVFIGIMVYVGVTGK